MGYNKIVLYGEQWVDYLQVLQGNNFNKQQIINDFFQDDYVPSWIVDTIILCDYDNNIDSTNIENLNSTITGWDIYRLDVDTNILSYVMTTPQKITAIKDYLIGSYKPYKYLVFPLTSNEAGVSFESKIIEPNFDKWTIYSILPTETKDIYKVKDIWNFKLNLQSSDITQNIDKTVFENYSKYPKISVGDKNYLQGSITAWLGNVKNANYVNDNINILQQWRNFIIDGTQKILKDSKGQVMMVDLITPSNKYIDEAGRNPTSITINYVQTNDINDISVYGDSNGIL